MTAHPFIRGGLIHNSRLVMPVADALAGIGAQVQFERLVCDGVATGFIDAAAQIEWMQVAIEGESRADRGAKDLWKCETLKGHWLLIPTPTRGAARAISRAVSAQLEAYGPTPFSICCQPVGLIVDRILRIQPRGSAEAFDELFRPIALYYHPLVSDGLRNIDNITQRREDI